MADGEGGGAGKKDGKGKRKGDAGESAAELREGQLLLGIPTFTETENGRFRCVETGHELSSRDMIDSYGRSKGCRVALIDAALKNLKPPLNMFKQDPKSKLKLICKLTGDTINKSEEHIWKHISGKKFQKKLDQKEADMKPLTSNGATKKKPDKEKNAESRGTSSAGEKSKGEKMQDTAVSLFSPDDDLAENSGSEELDFWVPPIGSRWDHDDGKDRWEISASETDEANPKDETEAVDLSAKTKRVSADVGPANFETKKKKSRTKN